MTAGPDEDQRAGQAQAQGETAAHAHESATQQQHTISGSSVAVGAPATPDSHAVGWFGSGANAAEPTLRPTEPRPIGEQGNHPPPAA